LLLLILLVVLFFRLLLMEVNVDVFAFGDGVGPLALVDTTETRKRPHGGAADVARQRLEGER
jgi:hypothetical protein